MNNWPSDSPEALPEELQHTAKSDIDWPRLASEIDEPFSIYVMTGPRGHGPVANDELLEDAAEYCAEGGTIDVKHVLEK